MKPGLLPGIRETMEVRVTRDMTAAFGGVEVHPVLSTVSMVYYMEWVGRRILLPYLEEHEEGVGGAISVRHRAPAPVGCSVIFTAEVVKVKLNKVICRVQAEHAKAIIGEGEFVQAVLPKRVIKERICKMKQ
jgi:fluoroacetyl-CoA thioesterase